MKFAITPVEDIGILTISQVAWDMHELLSRPDNQDIADEIPETFARFTASRSAALYQLHEKRNSIYRVRHQDFVTFSGKKAVGMFMLTIHGETPAGVDEEWPNISGFVCNPYRNQGLGELSIQRLITEVDNQFFGGAWARINATNQPAQALARGAGLHPVAEEAAGIVYIYDRVAAQ